jgi:hypothetical protein
MHGYATLLWEESSSAFHFTYLRRIPLLTQLHTRVAQRLGVYL